MAQNAAEKADADEDEKDATHAAAAEKANVERTTAAAGTQDEVEIAEKANVERVAEKADAVTAPPLTDVTTLGS